MLLNKKVIVIGGPIPQKIDPVLELSPTGKGNLASAIANQFAQEFAEVKRLGNFDQAQKCDFDQLKKLLKDLGGDVVIFMPHLPNIKLEIADNPFNGGKIRLKQDQLLAANILPNEKLINSVKAQNPQVLLVAFKIADPESSYLEIVKWMLEIHAGLAVYSRLGDSQNFWLIDALGNEEKFSKKDLPVALVEKVKKYMLAIRYQSKQMGTEIPMVPHLQAFLNFSGQMKQAFSQAMAKNVRVDRWPGNFSFRCSHGFLSARLEQGFVITKRDVDKTGLTANHFVFVGQELNDEKLIYWGAENAKPSIDAPVHRVIYKNLPWAQSIIHGHLHVHGENVHENLLEFWPCGAENEGLEVVSLAMNQEVLPLRIYNIRGHGFIALISDENPTAQLDKLASLEFNTPV